MLRLAERIATMNAFPNKLIRNDEGCIGRLRMQKEMIARRPVLCLDNVANFYAAHDKQEWDIELDFPNFTPIFPFFFAEWNEPKTWNMKSGPVEKDSAGQVGLCVVAVDVGLMSTKSDATKDGLRQELPVFLGGMTGVNPKLFDEMTLQKCWDLLQSSRWIMSCDSWLSSSKPPVCGSPLFMGVTYLLFISPEGKVNGHVLTGIGASAIAASNPGSVSELWSALHILGLGLSFCHCKNVTQERVTYNAGKPAQGKGNKVPALKFYTLNIDPMKKTLRTEGQSESVGLAKALHICRGHFAHYTPEHPLFGKYVGTFWRPAHVRGSQENGVVVKDYSVKL